MSVPVQYVEIVLTFVQYTVNKFCAQFLQFDHHTYVCTVAYSENASTLHSFLI